MKKEKDCIEVKIYNQFWNKFYKRIQCCENENDLEIVKQDIVREHENLIHKWENLPAISVLLNCKDRLLESAHRKELSFNV